MLLNKFLSKTSLILFVLLISSVLYTGKASASISETESMTIEQDTLATAAVSDTLLVAESAKEIEIYSSYFLRQLR